MTETFDTDRIRLTLGRGRIQTRVRAEPRDLRPGTGGLVQFPYRGKLEGWVTARLRVASEPGRPSLLRTFRVKL